MYELWAKKRPVNGVGHQYELVSSFENETAKFSELDKLDPSIFQEATIIDSNGSAVMFKEYEKPYTKAMRMNTEQKK